MKYNINLLPESKRESLLDRVFYFVINYLRYIIVITQLVVICVFFVKFAIDQQLVDLQESIEQKGEILGVFQPLVKQARDIDLKSTEIKKIMKSQVPIVYTFDYLMQRFPEDFYLNRIELAQDTAVLKGVTVNVDTLRAFIQRLKKEGKYAIVNLKTIRRVEKGYEFIIEIGKMT